jgi:hypothetical protein
MAKAKIIVAHSPTALNSVEARKSVHARVALRALKRAMGDFDEVEVAEPAVKPKREAARAIKKAVRAFYQKRHAVERN